MPALTVALITAWFGWKLNGEINLANELRRTEIQERTEAREQTNQIRQQELNIKKIEDDRNSDLRRLELEARNDERQERKQELDALNLSVARATQKMQEKLGTESSLTERRRADIEEKRQRIETIRLTSEIVKARNSLIPNLDIDCKPQGRYTAVKKTTYFCTALNNGEHRVTYTVDATVTDPETGQNTPKGVKKVTGVVVNTLPAKASGSGPIFIEFDPGYEGNPGNLYKLVIRIKAKTEEKVINNVKLMAKDLLQEDDYESMGTANFVVGVDF